MADLRLNVVIGGVEKSISTVNELEQALRATREELKNVAIGSDAFQKLSDQAVNLQREFVNSYKETTNFNKNIAELGQSVGSLASTITSGFTIATSAIGLFAGESEELSQTQVRAQQALALAISATTIATNAKTIAEDINNVGVALQNGLTKLLTISLGQQTIATAAQAAATGTATVAQRALNAAMAANPIGLLLAAVAALVGAFVLFGKEEENVIKKTRDLNEEIDDNTSKIRDNIKTQKELIQLQGQLAEAQATTEIGRLEARLDTQRKLDQLNKEDIIAQQKNVEDKIQNYAKDIDANAKYVEALMKQTKDSQDFNLDSRLTEEQQAYASIIRRRDLGLITEKQYTEEVIKTYQQFFNARDQQDQDNFQKQADNYKKLVSQRNQLVNDLKVAEEAITTNEKIAEEERRRQREEDAKRYADNLKKRKSELEAYNKDVIKLEEDRAKRIREIERQLQDFQLDRISLVATEDGALREDLVAGYDETIAKLKVARDRQLEDEKMAFEASLKAFEDTEKKRVDNNGKRLITDKQIQDELAKRRLEYAQYELKVTESFSQQIVEVENEKAQQIAEIGRVLNQELIFGDNNMSDAMEQIKLNDLNFAIDIKQRELELERQSMMDRLFIAKEESDGKRRTQIELLVQLQELQRQQREAERAAQLQALAIQRAEDLKNIQGDETQKGEQKKRIIEFYKREEDKINENFRLKDKEAERKNLQEIAELRNQKLTEIVAFAANVANTILGLFSAITELNRVNSENFLRDERDKTAQQTNDLNVEYNKQKESLDAKLQAGVISQEQYNQTVRDLDQNLTSSTEALNKKFREKELAEKKKAFESEKRLKIAQTIISGIQGAVTAFTSAFQLGPIAGPIVGGILAALVATTTAVQVAAIASTKFDSGAPTITPPNTGGGAGAGEASAASVLQQQAGSTGGFTQFNQALTGDPTGGGTPGSTTGGMTDTRVYVLESDITATQRRVSIAESTATFG